MALTAAKEDKMRPPRTTVQRERTRGKRRKQIGFKPDELLEQYLESEATTQGWTITTVVVDMLETQRQLEEVLGDDWWEIEKLALTERASKGQVLAGLVREALARRSKR